MLSDTLRMIDKTLPETMKLMADKPELCKQYGLVARVIHARADMWIEPLDETESSKRPELAHQGGEFERQAVFAAIEPLAFFLAWGYEVATNPKMVMPREWCENFSDAKVASDEMDEMLKTIQDRLDVLAPNRIEFKWLEGFVIKNYRESLEFYDKKVGTLKGVFTNFSAPKSSWARSRYLHAFEVSAQELYHMGLRLGPAMRDQEILDKMMEES